DGIRDLTVTGVQTCALPILPRLVLRRVRHPHIPHALGIGQPGDAPVRRRGDQLRRERRAENILERELRRVRDGGDEEQRDEPLHAFEAMLVTLPLRSPITQLPWKIAPSSMISAGVSMSL